MTQERINCLEAEVRRLRSALGEIAGRLRWVGYVEDLHPEAGKDMREIGRIIHEATGVAYPEYN